MIHRGEILNQKSVINLCCFQNAVASSFQDEPPGLLDKAQAPLPTFVLCTERAAEDLLQDLPGPDAQRRGTRVLGAQVQAAPLVQMGNPGLDRKVFPESQPPRENWEGQNQSL